MTDKKKEEKPSEEKKPLDMTTEEAMGYLFPKKAIDHLKQVAHEKDAENGNVGSTQEEV